MATWTHRICEGCWFNLKAHVERHADGSISFFTPLQLKPDPDEVIGTCCYCGGYCVTFIFVRDDPSAMICAARHDDDELRSELIKDAEEEARRRHCGDYPASCNCDDPETHGGH